MTGAKDSSLRNGRSSIERRPAAFGAIALTLWGLAVACSAIDALLAFDRIKVLVFSTGVLMMDIAGAVLFSWFWFQVRTPPGIILTPADLAVFGGHIWQDGYDAGHDAARAESSNARLFVPRQDAGPIRGYYTATVDDRATDHVS